MSKTYIPYLIGPEQALITQFGPEPKFPIIAVSGLSGSGKDTYIARLQKDLAANGYNLEIHQAGTIFRQVAAEQGYSGAKLHEFAKIATNELHRSIEERILKIALEKGGIIVGRLAVATVGEWSPARILLTCKPEAIARRIASDPSRPEYGQDLEVIADSVAERDRADVAHLEAVYGINYLRHVTKSANLILDNSVDGAQEEVSRQMLTFVLAQLEAAGFAKHL